MNTYLTAWALCMVAGCFVITAVVIVVETRRTTRRPAPRFVPRIPVQRSAAVIVPVVDPVMFDDFLAELMITPHVEDVLS